MSTIFVSYSHMDRKWLDPAYPYALIPWLENTLRRDGATLWYDRSDVDGLQAGDQFHSEILDADRCSTGRAAAGQRSLLCLRLHPMPSCRASCSGQTRTSWW